MTELLFCFGEKLQYSQKLVTIVNRIRFFGILVLWPYSELKKVHSRIAVQSLCTFNFLGSSTGKSSEENNKTYINEDMIGDFFFWSKYVGHWKRWRCRCLCVWIFMRIMMKLVMRSFKASSYSLFFRAIPPK